MADVVKVVRPIELGSWADELAELIRAVSAEVGDEVILETRFFGEETLSYGAYIKAVGLVVDEEDPEDTAFWELGLFDFVPDVGHEV